MNNCNFYGRISTDIEVSYSKANEPMAIANFCIAVNRKGKEKKADFFSFVAFGKTAENIEKFFRKGNRISLRTHAQRDDFTDRDGNKRSSIKFIVDDFDIVETKNENDVSSLKNTLPEESPYGTADSYGFLSIPDGVDDDSLPFN